MRHRLPRDELQREVAHAYQPPPGEQVALAELGVDVALYDGSLTEWAADPQAPLETG